VRTARTSGKRGPVGVAVVAEVALSAAVGPSVVAVREGEFEGLDELGDEVQAATAPRAPVASPPRTARRVTERGSTGASINRG
jgi:hypothetical protein